MMRNKKNKKNSLSLIFFSLCLVLVFGLIFAFIGSSNKGETETAEQTTLITFNVDETEYQCPKNWAWAQYVNSVYSDYFTVDDDYVYLQNGIVACQNEKVLKTDRIVANANYTIIPLLSFSIDETECQTESNMTWTEWVNSRYNKNNYAIIGNYVHSQSGVITYNNSNVLKTSAIIENAEYDIVSTIAFTLSVSTTDNENGADGVLCECRAENGMTWAQWLASGYNYLNVTTSNGYVVVDNYFVHNYSIGYILSSDTIVNDYVYFCRMQTITFTVDNVNYTAENGMTWSIWVNSPYNTNNYIIFGNNIAYNNSLVANNGYVQKTDEIINNTSYTLDSTISFNIGNTTYQSTGLVVQTTWATWVNSAFNTDNYTVVGDYIYSAQNGVVTYNGNNVLKTDIIVANRNYTLTQTISFTVFGNTYNAISGMTWSQFVNSDFNTKPFVVNGNTIKNSSSGSSVVFNDTGSIAPTDVIVANYSYNISVPVGDGLATDIITVGAQTYRVRRNATWSQWLENGYGVVTNDFTIDSNNYIHSQNGFVTYNGNNVVKTDTLVRGATYTIVIPTISFTIDNVSYTAQSGMTWAQWVASANNTANFTIDSNNNVSCQNGLVTYNNASVVNTDTIVANASYTIVAPISKPFELSAMTWNGLTNLTGSDVWTDGVNYYYSNNSNQYVLDVSTHTWSAMTWNGLSSFYGQYVWTDGVNYYYSNFSSNQYVLDVSTHTWSAMTWNGFTNLTGSDVWTDGVNYYYSDFSSGNYVLDVSTHTWSAMTWNGLTSFAGARVWTDGVCYYYSFNSNQYVLDVSTHTWSAMTWNGFTNLTGSGVWTDGVCYYYSFNSNQYVLDVSTHTWSAITWGVGINLQGSNFWTDGTNFYYSSSSYQYILSITN